MCTSAHACVKEIKRQDDELHLPSHMHAHKSMNRIVSTALFGFHPFGKDGAETRQV